MKLMTFIFALPFLPLVTASSGSKDTAASHVPTPTEPLVVWADEKIYQNNPQEKFEWERE